MKSKLEKWFLGNHISLVLIKSTMKGIEEVSMVANGRIRISAYRVESSPTRAANRKGSTFGTCSPWRFR